MKKAHRKDFLNILILILTFLVVYFALTKFEFLYGSMKDWNQQHWVIPDYFRKLFYETHDLFPDFAFNLGGGQNIYNFSYYGLLSPIILISYLLPFIEMRDYIIIATIFMLLLSVILMYFFIKGKKGEKIAFVCSFIFMLATPLIFHSHRHIMFMNYMPFLILGYFGVDNYFEKKKIGLLSISVFLMIMTSYFFSVSGIVSIIIYGVYCYIKMNNSISFKVFVKDGTKFLIPILIGVLMSGVLIVPTFYSLLMGRSSGSSINVLELFLPDFNIKNLLYSSYSVGISSIGLFSFINGYFSTRENKFLSYCLSIILIFPIFIYMLNGFLYAEAKVLITFLPLFILLVSNMLDSVVRKKINFKFVAFLFIFVCSLCLFVKGFSLVFVLACESSVMLLCVYLLYRRGTFKYFNLILFPVLVVVSISLNSGDNLVSSSSVDYNEDLVSNVLESDDSFYRIGIYNKNLDDVNRVYDSEYYTSSMYSSSSSSNYMDFYYNSLGNEIIFRTYRMMPNPNNLFFNIYMGNKYIVSDRYDSSLYEEVEDGVYKSDDVLPIGYAGQKLMSLSYYNTLSYPENIYAYLNYTIVDDDNIDSIYDSVFERIDLDYEIVSSDVEIKETDRGIYIDVLKNSELKLKINNDLDEKILLLSFKMDYNTSCSVGDQTITINGIKNKLSCDSWKYHNNNYVFEYVLSDNDLDELDVVFSKGVFLISEFEFYVIDKDDIEKIDDDISEFVIDREKTKGDVIYGSIDVLDDGYFNLSIPYDEGFSIFVDGEEVTYERVNVNFIGFKISEGKHDIVIKYASPLKSVGIIFSIIGFILLLGGRFMVSLIEFVGGFMNGKLGKFVKDMYFKYKEIFNYLVVGVLTTLVSLGSKWILLFTILDAGDAFELQLAIIISWIIAVFFAYFANRIFVFNSKNKNIFKEMIQFFGARVLTLIMEMVIMWFFVTLLGLDSNIWVMIWTFVTQVLIMIFNYIFSKLFVFKKK